MKTKLYLYLQPNYLFSRTAIEAEILFAVCLSKKQALTGGKSLAREDKCSKKIGAESAVLNFVFFVMLKNKIEQSATQSCLKNNLLLNRSTDRSFENRPMKKVRPCTFFIPEFCLGKTLKAIITAIRGGELGKKVPQAYRVYVEDTFLPCDAGDARIFSK
ncbi:hypothetical protein, partial [Treponema putidum]